MDAPIPVQRALKSGFVLLAVLAGWWAASSWVGPFPSSAVETPDVAGTPDAPFASEPAGSPPRGSLYPVRIRVPDHLPGVDTGLIDPKGRVVTVGCTVCHSIIDEERRASQPSPGTSSGLPDTLTAQTILELRGLKGFHKEMPFAHGSLTCFACHDPDDYESFRLADGRSISPGQVIDLCSQCHGPQRASYNRGAHGGMVGHWDLTRGPRDRNTCTDCHRAHQPKPGSVLPVPRSVDRFVEPIELQEAPHAR